MIERLPRPARAAVRLAGLVVVALSLVFVGAHLAAHEPWRLEPRLLRALLGWTALGAVAYACSGLLLSSAWRFLLAGCGHPLPAAAAHAVYGRTQIAKYLPSNLLHLAGRHLMGRALGITHGRLVRAALFEAVGLALCAGLLALHLVIGPAWLLAPIALAPLIAIAGRRRSPPLLGRRAALASAGLCYLAFFAVGGAILWLLVVAAADAADASGVASAAAFARCLGLYALAWLAGFVAVGAAAGVGVREAVLIAGLTGLTGAAESAAVALALRVISTAGDALFFGASLAVRLPSGPRLAQQTKGTEHYYL